MTAASDLASTGAALAVAGAQVGARIRVILTPDQVRVLDDHHERMEGRRGSRRERIVEAADEMIGSFGPAEPGT